MLRDAEHFKSKIGGIDGAGDAGDYIVTLVKAKTVPKPTPSAPEVEVPAKGGTESGDVAAVEAPSKVDEKWKQEEKQVDGVGDQVAA